MFKFIFIFLIVFGAVTTVEPIRSRVMPPLARALGPTGEKMMTPIKKWQARTDLENMLQQLRQENTAGRRLPDASDFTAWANRAFLSPKAGTDPWGEKYYMKPGRGRLILGSAGPDMKPGTNDDILVTTPWG